MAHENVVLPVTSSDPSAFATAPVIIGDLREAYEEEGRGLGTPDDWNKQESYQRLVASMKRREEVGWLPGGMDEQGPPAKRFRAGSGLFQSFRGNSARGAAPAAAPAPAQGLHAARMVRIDESMAALRQRVDDVYRNCAPNERKFLCIAYYLVDVARMSGHVLETEHELCIQLLFDGWNWRAHEHQLFHYQDRCWDMLDGFKNETMTLPDFGKDVLLAVEGLFIKLSTIDGVKNTSWSWTEIRGHVHTACNEARQTGSVLGQLSQLAKKGSDHLRIATDNKVWKAHWTARLAEVVLKARKQLAMPHHLKETTKLFLQKCNTPKPKSRGICWADVCLGGNWGVCQPSPDNNVTVTSAWSGNIKSQRQTC